MIWYDIILYYIIYCWFRLGIITIINIIIIIIIIIFRVFFTTEEVRLILMQVKVTLISQLTENHSCLE